MVTRGRARRLGDDVNTDLIIPGKYLNLIDLGELKDHVLEGLDPQFAGTLRPGDILVAGRNFGSGSGREQAALALKHAGIGAVVARSFSRTFFRNAINAGLPVVELGVLPAAEGELLELDLAGGRVVNRDTGRSFSFEPYPRKLLAIVLAGGLVEYVRQRSGQ